MVLLLPFVFVVLIVGKHVANINSMAVIVNGGNQPDFIACDIKNGQFANLICVRE